MKFTFGLLAGITIGAAVVHYLSSREGKALVNKIKDDVDEVGEKFSELAEDLVQKGKSLIGNTNQDGPIVEETVVLLVRDQP